MDTGVAPKASTLLDLTAQNVKEASEILDSLYALEEKLFGGGQSERPRPPLAESVSEREAYLSQLLADIRDKTHFLHRGVGTRNNETAPPNRLR